MPRLAVNTNASAIQMAESIFGDGVTVSSATYSGANGSSGIYSNGDTVSPDATPGDTGVILSTGNARDFSNRNGGYNQDTNQSTNTSGSNYVEGASDVTNASTYDSSVLEVSFIPTGDTMTVQFVFSSEEFPEYTNSIYQDFVGVWVNDQYVPMEIGNIDPSSVNAGTNENLFVNNSGGTYNTEMDGFTLTMTLTMTVNPGILNTIRFVIADVSDSSYDSNLLIAGDSVQTAVIAHSDEVNIGLSGSQTVDVLSNDFDVDAPSGSTLTLTHINGEAVGPGSVIVLATGQIISVNADGTITISAGSDEETVNFTYTVENDDGVSDVGFVTVNVAPCFVSGTLIRTPYGDVPVEDLEVGDMVQTYDDGTQPIRWIGNRMVPAEGALAPVRIEAGTYGKHGALLVSPQHRILVRNSLAEVLFGESEVLIAAKDLVNDSTVRRQVGGEVTYFHILFDQHQIVFSQGLESESFLPGPQITNLFEAEIVDEICTIFPELDADTGLGYSQSARRELKTYEADVLLRRGKVA